MLLARARSGDEEAFAALWRRHLPAAHAAATPYRGRVSAEDLVAEASARLFRLLSEGRGPSSNFRAYFVSTVRTVGVDAIRREMSLVPTSTTDLDLLPGPDEGLSALSAQGVDTDLVREAFLRLSEGDRRLLWQTMVEGHPPRVVAPELGVSANVASARAKRARDELRDRYLDSWLRRRVPVCDASDCRWTLDHLSGHVRGRLTERQRARVEAHLASCPRESGLARELQRVYDGFGALTGPLLFAAGATMLGGLPAGAFAALVGSSTTGATTGATHERDRRDHRRDHGRDHGCHGGCRCCGWNGRRGCSGHERRRLGRRRVHRRRRRRRQRRSRRHAHRERCRRDGIRRGCRSGPDHGGDLRVCRHRRRHGRRRYGHVRGGGRRRPRGAGRGGRGRDHRPRLERGHRHSRRGVDGRVDPGRDGDRPTPRHRDGRPRRGARPLGRPGGGARPRYDDDVGRHLGRRRHGGARPGSGAAAGVGTTPVDVLHLALLPAPADPAPADPAPTDPAPTDPRRPIPRRSTRRPRSRRRPMRRPSTQPLHPRHLRTRHLLLRHLLAPAPADPAPSDPTPVDPAPAPSAPAAPAPDAPAPSDATPADPTPVDPAPAAPSDATPVDPTPVDPALRTRLFGPGSIRPDAHGSCSGSRRFGILDIRPCLRSGWRRLGGPHGDERGVQPRGRERPAAFDRSRSRPTGRSAGRSDIRRRRHGPRLRRSADRRPDAGDADRRRSPGRCMSPRRSDPGSALPCPRPRRSPVGLPAGPA